jgi:lysozyme
LISSKVLGLCLPLIERFEQGPSGSFSQTAYIDPAGNWTIGWGHKLTVNDPLLHAAITAEQAAALRNADLDRQNTYLVACLGDTYGNLTVGQQAAVVDFCFNLGIGRFENSTMHHYIVTGRLEVVPGEFGRWVNAGNPPKPLAGLVKRRAAEKALWEMPA